MRTHIVVLQCSFSGIPTIYVFSCYYICTNVGATKSSSPASLLLLPLYHCLCVLILLHVYICRRNEELLDLHRNHEAFRYDAVLISRGGAKIKNSAPHTMCCLYYYVCVLVLLYAAEKSRCCSERTCRKSLNRATVESLNRALIEPW